MALTEQSLISGHADFHNKCRPALSNKRGEEMASLGEKPVADNPETPTPQETEEIAAWTAKNNRIIRATAVMRNQGRHEANDFYEKVMSEMIRLQSIDVTGVTDANLKDKIASIDDVAITTAVEAVYNRG